MKIQHVSPEIPRFGTPDVADWFKVERNRLIDKANGHPPATPQPLSGAQEQHAATDWVTHDGGSCPIDPEARVEVKMRDGGTDTAFAKNFSWTHEAVPAWCGDILQYRVISWPAPQSPAAPEWHTGKPPKEGMYVTDAKWHKDPSYQYFDGQRYGQYTSSVKNAYGCRDLESSEQDRPWRYLNPAEQAEYDALTAQHAGPVADGEGWVAEWDFTKKQSPAPYESQVEVLLRSGLTLVLENGGHGYWWGRDGSRVDVLRYRILP